MSKELNKYFKSEPIEIERSKITLANYNPRKISDEAKRKLKANIKKNGLMGGIVFNEQTGNLVSGHQRLTILDEINKYYPSDKETDYIVRVEKVDLDPKTEREQNIFMNNTTVMGEFDEDLMRDLIPEIDYQLAGLDDYDLNLYGIDLSDFENEEIEDEIEELYAPVAQQKEERKQAVKEMKQQIKEKAESKAQDMESYVTLSFSSYQAKSAFMQRFGYDPLDKFIKGEVFSENIERIN